MTILLTGANGFVGQALYTALTRQGHTVGCAVRQQHALFPEKGDRLSGPVHRFDTLDRRTDFSPMLSGVAVVIHLAARAHMPTRNDFDMHEDFLEINYHGTCRLARQAAEQGVKRLIFISSIGVNGKSTPDGYQCTEKDDPKPYNSYTISKLKAEQALQDIHRETGMEVIIIRPPLVYGPRVKANFFKLMNLVSTGLPLPFAHVHNARSFVALENLVDAVCLCVTHPAAAGQTFIVCDDQALSTPVLLEKIAAAMNRPLRLFHCPPAVARAGLRAVGKKGIFHRLWGNLAASSDKICRDLGWQPKVSVDEGIRQAVSWYGKENRGWRHLVKGGRA